MKIEDNFLEQKELEQLQKTMLGPTFTWNFGKIDTLQSLHNQPQKSFVTSDDVDNFHFVHLFYAGGSPCSPHFEVLNPIFKIIQAASLIRIKANLRTRTPNIIENEFHVDLNFFSEEKRKQWTTSIFYVNTNNGYTKFEDGTIIESIANRLITFPSNMEHTGTSCTDENTRVLINFNYFKK